MRLRVMVEVIDGDGTKVRRLKTVEVPAKVLKINAVLCESRDELRNQVADDAISKALSTVMTPEAAMGPADLPSLSAPSGGGASPKDAKLEQLLGLGLMEHMDSLDAQRPMYGVVTRDSGGRTETVTGPPPIGYGPGTPRR